jgi:hypothetical protein
MVTSYRCAAQSDNNCFSGSRVQVECGSPACEVISRLEQSEYRGWPGSFRAAHIGVCRGSVRHTGNHCECAVVSSWALLASAAAPVQPLPGLENAAAGCHCAAGHQRGYLPVRGPSLLLLRISDRSDAMTHTGSDNCVCDVACHSYFIDPTVYQCCSISISFKRF